MDILRTTQRERPGANYSKGLQKGLSTNTTVQRGAVVLFQVKTRSEWCTPPSSSRSPSTAPAKHVQPQDAAAFRSIQFFEFMCLSACSCSVCTGDILPAPCLPSLFLFVLS